MARYAVRFRGILAPDVVAALKERHIQQTQVAGFFSTPAPEPSTTVVVWQAASSDDAVRRVRDALEGHGEFSDFIAEP
jgi:hypothetical protein